MKLLITLDFPPEKGGIQTYLSGIVTHTFSAADVVMAGAKKACAEVPFPANAIVHYYVSWISFLNKKFSLLSMIVPYYVLCKNHRGRLDVSCGNIYAAIIPWLLFPLTRQPYSIYTYGTELCGLQKNSPGTFVLRRILDKAAMLYTLGTYSTGLLQKVSRSKCITVICPKIERVSRQLPTKRNSRSTAKILSVGRLVRHKGFATLIRATAACAARIRLSVVIAGNGPDHAFLTGLIGETGVENSVTILSNVSDEALAVEYETASLFVLPSLETGEGTEGFGMVLLEAMAYRLPIIASACGGIPEVVDDGKAGVLVEPGNSTALAGAIIHCIENPAFTDTLVMRASERLVTHYVW
jgi:phosphatidylinositol alpha-1,6-mannosyltransferase